MEHSKKQDWGLIKHKVYYIARKEQDVAKPNPTRK